MTYLRYLNCRRARVWQGFFLTVRVHGSKVRLTIADYVLYFVGYLRRNHSDTSIARKINTKINMGDDFLLQFTCCTTDRWKSAYLRFVGKSAGPFNGKLHVFRCSWPNARYIACCKMRASISLAYKRQQALSKIDREGMNSQ